MRPWLVKSSALHCLRELCRRRSGCSSDVVSKAAAVVVNLRATTTSLRCAGESLGPHWRRIQADAARPPSVDCSDNVHDAARTRFRRRQVLRENLKTERDKRLGAGGLISVSANKRASMIKRPSANLTVTMDVTRLQHRLRSRGFRSGFVDRRCLP